MCEAGNCHQPASMSHIDHFPEACGAARAGLTTVEISLRAALKHITSLELLRVRIGEIITETQKAQLQAEAWADTKPNVVDD